MTREYSLTLEHRGDENWKSAVTKSPSPPVPVLLEERKSVSAHSYRNLKVRLRIEVRHFRRQNSAIRLKLIAI